MNFTFLFICLRQGLGQFWLAVNLLRITLSGVILLPPPRGLGLQTCAGFMGCWGWNGGPRACLALHQLNHIPSSAVAAFFRPHSHAILHTFAQEAGGSGVRVLRSVPVGTEGSWHLPVGILHPRGLPKVTPAHIPWWGLGQSGTEQEAVRGKPQMEPL